MEFIFVIFKGLIDKKFNKKLGKDYDLKCMFININ